jgi:hypothetical protein
MSLPLIMHKLQVSVSHGDSVITLPAARGPTLAINSAFVTKGGKHRNTIELGSRSVVFPPCHGHVFVHQIVELCSCRCLELEEFSQKGGNTNTLPTLPPQGTR